MAKNILLSFPMPVANWKIYRKPWQIHQKKLVAKDVWSKIVGIKDNTEKWLKEKEMMEQKARDAIILDKKDRKEALKHISSGKGDGFLVRRDLSSKDGQLIKKMNVLSEQTGMQAAKSKKEFKMKSTKTEVSIISTKNFEPMKKEKSHRRSY
ncbi:unnamed protein product [Blepharisma stoltei]|uniref:Uncharacterized protein n=1 Tax=Blepharisma stoltei TaxID=1481888 RepID=A0AAU9KBQ1_9CILI|nr:unnamed protein product [Blepharisma stoltei]